MAILARLVTAHDSYCYLIAIRVVFFSGLVADKTKSYHATFFSAGGIQSVGLLILLMFLCVKRGDFTEKKFQNNSEKVSFTELPVIDRETVL